MKTINLFLVFVLQIVLAGCVSKTVPEISKMQKLDKDEIKLLVIGNTLTYQAVWGRWAEYSSDNYDGHAGIWENLIDYYGFEGETATLTFEFSDDAEFCRRYSGDAGVGANPELNYCSMIYMDNGEYYIVDTKNSYNTNFIGFPHILEIKQGDYYDLSNGSENQRVRKEK